VTIPNSVTNIGNSAFADCTGLTAIMVDTRNPVYSDVDGVLFNQSLTTLVAYPGGITGSYTVPECVTNIGDYAFEDCQNLTSVTIPSSVTSIGDDAFYGCGNLTSVYFQGNSPSFGADLFFDYWGNNGSDSGLTVYDPVTIYYLPGTVGFSNLTLIASFNDGHLGRITNYVTIPAVLWTPQVQGWVAMRDHVTNYSKGNTEPARMMTPFLASNVFGSIRSNSTTNFCPSLNWHGHSLAACSTVWTLRGHHVWTVGACPSAH